MSDEQITPPAKRRSGRKPDPIHVEREGTPDPKAMLQAVRLLLETPVSEPALVEEVPQRAA